MRQKSGRPSDQFVFYYISYPICFSSDVNPVNADGNTPLHIASLSCKTECMRLLLRGGATDSLNIGTYPLVEEFPRL